MQRFLMGCVTAAVVLLSGGIASAELIKVMQESSPGARDFESNVLGYIESYSTAETLSAYYAYENSSFNGPDPITSSRQSHLFVVDGADGTGVFAVHDSQDGSGGQFWFELRQYVDDILVSGGGGAFDIIQNDDPDDIIYMHSGSIEVIHNWLTNETDGIAVGTPDGNWSIEMQLKVDPLEIDNWIALGSAGEVISLDIGVGRKVKLTPAPLNIEVNVDIKPGDCPNSLNVKAQGLLAVAVLGTVDFDVEMIDVASIRLSGVYPVRSSIEDTTAPLPDDAESCECAIKGSDGYDDMVLKFNVQDITEALDEVYDGEELELTLSGVLYDGTPIEGSDCIVIVSKGKLE